MFFPFVDAGIIPADRKLADVGVIRNRLRRI
jgi:hypothetical protein